MLAGLHTHYTQHAWPGRHGRAAVGGARQVGTLRRGCLLLIRAARTLALAFALCLCLHAAATSPCLSPLAHNTTSTSHPHHPVLSLSCLAACMFLL